jgi:hypothetical protein
MGITPATRASLPAGRKWSFVAFAAPPSGSEDYAGDVSPFLLVFVLFTTHKSHFVCCARGRSRTPGPEGVVASMHGLERCAPRVLPAERARPPSMGPVTLAWCSRILDRPGSGEV